MRRTKPVEIAWTCPCGYVFRITSSLKARNFRSFAVIPDRDYQWVIKLEAKTLQSANDVERLSAVGRSAKYVGSVHECPECGRLRLIAPGADRAVLYSREAAQDADSPDTA